MGEVSLPNPEYPPMLLYLRTICYSTLSYSSSAIGWPLGRIPTCPQLRYSVV